MADRSDALEPKTISEMQMSTYTKLDLRRKPRWGERIITAFLFISGAISILTTIGIVVVLGRETLNFFTHQMWEETNKPIVYAITPDETLIRISDTGKPIYAEDIIRLNEEVMLINSVQEGTIQVERGYQDTTPSEHAANTEINRGVDVTLIEFFTGTVWQPQLGDFGIWPLMTATLIVTAIGMLVALPVGLAIAIYLSEYASERARGILKPTLEVLAGIPTVVYGYFALTFITPILREVIGEDIVKIYNMASGGIVVGILIIPLVSSLGEDALSAVPRSLREAAYALGATKLETAVKIVLPAAISGVTAAFIIAISRAIGETMIVALAVGAAPNFTFNPFESAETMTGHIVRISGGDLSYDSIDYNSIFAIAMVLFLMTLSLNLISQRIVRRFREVYE
jgi:phosphate transport system permease protein